jgi:hypothetical protein
MSPVKAPTKAPARPPTSAPLALDCRVTHFLLWNADDKILVTNPTLVNGQTQCVPEYSMAIEAVLPNGCSGKVVIELKGPVTSKRTENSPPYMSFGNDPINMWDVNGMTLPAGAYTVSANLEKKASAALVVRFTLVDCSW